MPPRRGIRRLADDVGTPHDPCIGPEQRLDDRTDRRIARDPLDRLGEEIRGPGVAARLWTYHRVYDDMLILLGVNVFPSAVKEVVASFYPATTGELQIVLHEPGPKVAPPLKVIAECVKEVSDVTSLRAEIERKIKAILSIPAVLELVPAGTLPRFEMKGQLVRKPYQTPSGR